MLRRFALLAPLLALALAQPVAAEDPAPPALDQVHLRNGRTFEGTIVAEDDDGILLAFPSETGGEGRMRFPRRMVAKVVRGEERACPTGPTLVRDAWYLLRSGDRTVGTRRLALRRIRMGTEAGWRLEEDVVQFPQGKHVPTTRTQRMEAVDLAFHPRTLHHREISEASTDPDGPRRYERVLTGPVADGVWTALVRDGEGSTQQALPVPSDIRGRLSTREHLLRTRETGVQEVVLLDPGRGGLVTVRAGYTALGVPAPAGQPYDEFVWEEGGARLVSRFRDAEVVEEWVAEDVLSVPATQAQAAAAQEESERGIAGGEPDLVRLPELGLALRLPGDTWRFVRAEVPPGRTGWRRVGSLESRFFVADVRIEWDPDGVRTAPTADDAQAQLLQRLRAVAPDVQVVESRRPLGAAFPGGWRLTLKGSLRGETIRTVAVVVDRGDGRVLLLAACPEGSWAEAGASIERLLESLRSL